MVGITLFQTIGVAAVTVILLAFPRIRTSKTEFAILFPLALISVTGSMITLSFLRPITKLSTQLDQSKASIENLNRLNLTLRAQRHDFLNHLQVVYSLIDLKSFDEAAQYIEKVYSDIQKINVVLKTQIPAVNAILQAKIQMCESRDIRVVAEIHSTLSDVAIPEWELCRVLGNIIDNSINALQESERAGDKILKIELFESIRHHGFRITNNGPAIPQEIRRKIFEPGFTTRAGKGDGMGLTICRKILSEYGGSLKVESDSEATSFEGLIPRCSDK